MKYSSEWVYEYKEGDQPENLEESQEENLEESQEEIPLEDFQEKPRETIPGEIPLISLGEIIIPQKRLEKKKIVKIEEPKPKRFPSREEVFQNTKDLFNALMQSDEL